jgi:hypothetical protein
MRRRRLSLLSQWLVKQWLRQLLDRLIDSQALLTQGLFLLFFCFSEHG